MLSLLTTEKSFQNRWVGHRRLNERHSLHTRRMKLAARAVAIRRATAFLVAQRGSGWEALARDGYLAVPDFLPPDLFRQVSAEAEAAVELAERQHPVGVNREPGFGPKEPIAGGFDRWDGGTLNRFLTIQPAKMPGARAAAQQLGLSAYTRQIVGLPHSAAKTQIYLTVNGDDRQNYDLQRDYHRDTFFSAMKFWLFLRPVAMAEGPLHFVPGSHRLTPERLVWEQAEARRIVASGGRDPNAGGSFRVGEGDMQRMGLPEPVACICEANTLIIANTLGFHARGKAEPGTRRLALYGWRRPFPFGLLGR